MPEMLDKRTDLSDFSKVFLDDTPLFDVRAPIEFAKGSVPGAINLPLMTDQERESVGITYKEKGQDAAIECGHALVKGEEKASRVAEWKAFAETHPNGYLFCMRGGLRSQISQAWLQEAGVAYPLVRGGYKAMRRFLIEETERLVAKANLIIVAGRTGIGKTDFLGAVSNALDLEGLANHRGSSFGRRLGDQPTLINFENSLAVTLMKLSHTHCSPLFVEDESRRIGALEIPAPLSTKMADAPAIMIEEPLKARIDVIHRDYVSELRAEFQAVYLEEAEKAYGTFLLSALQRIKKRLGGARYKEIEALMRDALINHEKTGDDSKHKVWIERLLVEYYDPMYKYQLERRTRNILFTGSRVDAIAWSKCGSYG